MTRVLVTGASGNVGGAALRALLDRGVEAIAAVTRPPPPTTATTTATTTTTATATATTTGPVRGRGLGGVGHAVRHLDFFDQRTFAAALEGVTDVVLVRPPAIGDVARTLIPFIDAARVAGVGHIVFLSVVGADQNPLLPHTRVEKHLARQGRATFLRAGFFAQNLTDTWVADIVDDHRLFLPAGDGRVAFVDARDLGEAAALLLLQPPPRSADLPQGTRECVALDLTGAEALGLVDVAGLLTSATGRLVRYEPCSVMAFFFHLWRRRRMPLLKAIILTALHVGLRKNDAEHGAARVTTTLGEVLGRPPRSLAAFVGEHRRTLGATDG